MTASSTLTVRLPDAVKDQLTTLASHTRRTRSFLAAEAIADYVARELAVVEAIERGRQDVRAGRTTPDADVAKAAQTVIKAARKGR